MDPTRPIDSKRGPATAPGLRAVGAGNKPVASAGTATTAEVDAPSAIVNTQSGGALELVRGETARIDASKLDALAERVESGNYDVDPEALADRILDDALGAEIMG